jgi:hypothetical protein
MPLQFGYHGRRATLSHAASPFPSRSVPFTDSTRASGCTDASPLFALGGGLGAAPRCTVVRPRPAALLARHARHDRGGSVLPHALRPNGRLGVSDRRLCGRAAKAPSAVRTRPICLTNADGGQSLQKASPQNVPPTPLDLAIMDQAIVEFERKFLRA